MRYVVREWDCRFCGRHNRNLAESDGTVRCEYCREVARILPSTQWGSDASARLSLPSHALEQRESLRNLRVDYEEARRFGSDRGAHANLEWILGTGRSLAPAEAGPIEPKMIALAALWLSDLTVELDRLVDGPLAATDAEGCETNEARRSAARNLRAATERFVTAFRAVVVG